MSDIPAADLGEAHRWWPYRVEIDKMGCPACGRGALWTVIQPGDIAIGQSFHDKADADELAEYMNLAFNAAVARTTGKSTYTYRKEEQELERERCVALIRQWVHGAPTTTTENVLLAVIEDITNPDRLPVSFSTDRLTVSQVEASNTDTLSKNNAQTSLFRNPREVAEE